jgi:hypothetical protein
MILLSTERSPCLNCEIHNYEVNKNLCIDRGCPDVARYREQVADVSLIQCTLNNSYYTFR